MARPAGHDHVPDVDRPGHGVQRVRAAGEADTANIPPAQVDEAQENWGTTLDIEILGSYYFDFNDRDPSIGGEENLLLRQAISQGHRPRGDQRGRVQRLRDRLRPASRRRASPGSRQGSASTARTTPKAPRRRSTSGRRPATCQAAPLPIQFNADAGHEDVVGHHHREPGRDRHPGRGRPAADGDVLHRAWPTGSASFCRTGWFADYPTYDNFMYDLFHTDSLGGNNHGFSNPEFDALVDEAKQTVDPDEQAALFQQAEEILLNDDTMTVPINWYLRRLRLQPGEDQQLPADQLRSDPLGAGHAGRLIRSSNLGWVGALRRPHPPPIRTPRSSHGQLHHPPPPAADPDDLLRASRSSSSSSSSSPATRPRCSPAAATAPSTPA